LSGKEVVNWSVDVVTWGVGSRSLGIKAWAVGTTEHGTKIVFVDKEVGDAEREVAVVTGKKGPGGRFVGLGAFRKIALVGELGIDGSV